MTASIDTPRQPTVDCAMYFQESGDHANNPSPPTHIHLLVSDGNAKLDRGAASERLFLSRGRNPEGGSAAGLSTTVHPLFLPEGVYNHPIQFAPADRAGAQHFPFDYEVPIYCLRTFGLFSRKQKYPLLRPTVGRRKSDTSYQCYFWVLIFGIPLARLLTRT